MGTYNIVGNYYTSPTTSVKYYPITRQDNIDTMGTYARGITGTGDLNGMIPFTRRLDIDTNPSWATQQSNGSVVINRAGYYHTNFFFYAGGELQGYYFVVAIRCKRGANTDLNIAENDIEALDGNGVAMTTVGGIFYFQQGDTLYGNVGIDPAGGIHSSSMTSFCIKPYQFETVKYWG